MISLARFSPSPFLVPSAASMDTTGNIATLRLVKTFFPVEKGSAAKVFVLTNEAAGPAFSRDARLAEKQSPLDRQVLEGPASFRRAELEGGGLRELNERAR